ncbi:Hypothetical protein SMAX5B_013250 [Scophthalmus maximus]|uniref:Uncharacterized protein n=1 Tax=Scophthalmus maximus TaxID=52904 RepID=A0A2U9CSS8_SCOMX|nr:Hypothetical protein SMAX5B_013250 [Scophthalmus maximus]
MLWCTGCYERFISVHLARVVLCHKEVPCGPVVSEYRFYCPSFMKMWAWPGGKYVSSCNLGGGRFAAIGSPFPDMKTIVPALPSTKNAATQTEGVSWFWVEGVGEIIKEGPPLPDSASGLGIGKSLMPPMASSEQEELRAALTIIEDQFSSVIAEITELEPGPDDCTTSTSPGAVEDTSGENTDLPPDDCEDATTIENLPTPSVTSTRGITLFSSCTTPCMDEMTIVDRWNSTDESSTSTNEDVLLLSAGEDDDILAVWPSTDSTERSPRPQEGGVKKKLRSQP